MSGEHWPEANQVMEGKDAFRESTQEWLEVWKSVEGTMPIHMVLTVRDGRIARLEWYPDHDRAVAAARGA